VALDPAAAAAALKAEMKAEGSDSTAVARSSFEVDGAWPSNDAIFTPTSMIIVF
jgi:hypothetical protein